jgi:hypothetical protein
MGVGFLRCHRDLLDGPASFDEQKVRLHGNATLSVNSLADANLRKRIAVAATLEIIAMISLKRHAIFLLLSSLWFEQCSFAVSGDWSRFRGLDGAGVSDSSGLPSEFGPGRNVAWKTAVPEGCSSPVVSKDQIWLAGYESSHRYVLCLDLKTGRPLWQRSIEATVTEHKSKPNDPASSTPVTDGRNVYALFSDFGLVSYDLDGQERWRVPLGQPASKRRRG